MSEFLIESGQKVLFIGDSITDAGRRAEFAPFGRGYASMAINLMVAKYPDRDLTFVNRGIGGNTVRDLDGRWQEDCLDVKPDWLSVMIGINDVHRHYRDPEDGIGPDEYRATYTRILEQATSNGARRLVLVDPFYLCSNPNHDINKLLVPYWETVRDLVSRFDAIHVPVHDTFQEALKVRHDRKWSDDNVHPFPEGHAFIALEWLKAVGW